MIPKVSLIVESCVRSAVKEEILSFKEKMLAADCKGHELEFAEEDMTGLIMTAIRKDFTLCDNVGIVILRRKLATLKMEELGNLLSRREIADHEITSEQLIWLSENAEKLGTKCILVNSGLQGEVTNLHQVWSKRKA